MPAHYRATFFAFGAKVFLVSGNGIIVSNDGGTTWTLVDSTTIVAGLTASSTDLFVAAVGLFRSSDDGRNWTEADDGLAINAPFNIVSALAFAGNDLFAGTKSKGVFFSTDAGSTWTSISSGLPNNGIPNNLAYTQLFSLAVTDSFVLAGFNQGGIWRMPLSQTFSGIPQPSEQDPASFVAYPNPASNSISWDGL
ncbi:MAG TPA: hypothetical protein VGM92_14405, partial [Candidatus Kapabacteria bacterium]